MLADFTLAFLNVVMESAAPGLARFSLAFLHDVSMGSGCSVISDVAFFNVSCRAAGSARRNFCLDALKDVISQKEASAHTQTHNVFLNR